MEKQAAELSKQLLENQDKVRVRVLISNNADANAQNLLISAIRETLLSDRDIRGKIALTTYAINDTGTFASQESVKDMFDKQEDIPDILIALSEDHTNSAYQAVLDYNLAGQCNIIGYYDSDSIRNAIENEVIYSTVKTEATQMGTYCTQAMDEYKDAGYVSEFYAVDTNVMNKDNLPSHKGVSE